VVAPRTRSPDLRGHPRAWPARHRGDDRALLCARGAPHARGRCPPGAQLLAAPQINQGLVRFLDEHDDHDQRTDEVIALIQSGGDAWFGGTTWNGMRAMRISVVNWRTSDRDVDRAVAAVRDALAHPRSADG
jgi:hypothetical protein